MTEGGLAAHTDELVRAVNTAARDLARTLSGALPRRVEERWHRGDMASYTHYLANIVPQQVEAEVASEYAASPQLQEVVENYLTRFEELLSAVAASENGDELVDSCLNSDSGQLYLILKRALGREV